MRISKGYIIAFIPVLWSLMAVCVAMKEFGGAMVIIGQMAILIALLFGLDNDRAMDDLSENMESK